MNTTRRGFFPALVAIFAGIPVMLGMASAKETLGAKKGLRIRARNTLGWISKGWLSLLHTEDGWIVEQAACGNSRDVTVRWIPITERLPSGGDTSRCVLICHNMNKTHGGKRSVGLLRVDAMDDDTIRFLRITHWAEEPEMPLKMTFSPTPFSAKDYVILDGHHRIKAVRQLGMPTEMDWR